MKIKTWRIEEETGYKPQFTFYEDFSIANLLLCIQRLERQLPSADGALSCSQLENLGALQRASRFGGSLRHFVEKGR